MEEQNKRDKQAILQLYNQVLPALAEHIHRSVTPVISLFDNFNLERLLDTWTKDPASDSSVEVSIENGNIQQLGLRLRLEGFMKPGVEAFDLTKDLLFKLEHDSYTVGPDKNISWLEKGYLQRWENNEYEMVASRWSEELIDLLTERLEKLT
ncbi:hypothetical protein POKO110462_02470 [Pontibacter korlensis]|uniref:Uncharacterized protein n=1 Tax=Pontibacter korlensis TaxID=400092 RepID=A0A0E3ZFV1_9BACT|nr:hypothetical protein [Pontibacter korlensis]AKD03669.1 hypothetical protein PKOR_11685 [Pontibacter korlensis]